MFILPDTQEAIVPQDQWDRVQELRKNKRRFTKRERQGLFLALVERYVDIPELTPAIVNEFIKKIIVYEPEKSGPKRMQKVKIIFIFLDELDMLEIGEPVVTETVCGRRKTA